MFELLPATNGQHIIINESGVLQRHVTQYLLDLENIQCYERSYVRQIAYRLKAWLNWLGECDIYDVTDRLLCKYRDELKISADLEAKAINYRISSVCAFYWYAENTGLCSGVIGSNDMLKGRFYRIVVNLTRQGSSTNYTIPFLLGTVQQARKRIPSADEIAALKDGIADKTLECGHPLAEEINVRNQLMLRWMAEAGLRRLEVVSLPVSTIPTKFKPGTMVMVTLTKGTKFNKLRDVEVESSLIQETLDYIAYERPEIVRKCHAGHDAGVVFVSTHSANCGTFTAQAITDLLDSVDSDISPHALRRYALTRYAAYLYRIQLLLYKSGEIAEIDRRSIELRLTQQAGHVKISTTFRSYVDVALAMTLSDSGISSLEENRILLQSQLSMITSQIEAAKSLATKV
jgi:site-specific recombinase XerD